MVDFFFITNFRHAFKVFAIKLMYKYLQLDRSQKSLIYNAPKQTLQFNSTGLRCVRAELNGCGRERK
jgi:hypothetical protein